MIRLEHYPLEKLISELLIILGRYIDLKTNRVFFFGSRVSNKGDERSDIDVGIEGQEKIQNLEELKEFIEEDIKTLYKIDIVDFKDVSKDFYNVAKQHIQYIN